MNRVEAISWTRLCEEESDSATISPRTLLVHGPVTLRVEPQAAVVDPVIAAPRPVAPLWATHWRTAVCGVLAAAAAVLVVIAAGAPDPQPQQSEPLASVGAASPPTATALQPKTPAALPSAPVATAAVAGPEPAHPSAEEVIFVDDEDEATPEELDPDSKAARRARAKDVARASFRKARVAKAVGDFRAAETHYKDALAALPTYGPAAADLATLHIQRGKYESGLSYAKRAARSAPRKLGYMVLLGDAYHLVGRRAEATARWRRAAAAGSAKAKSRLARAAK